MKQNTSFTYELYTVWRSRCLLSNNKKKEEEDKEPSIVYSKDRKVWSGEEDNFYSNYLKLKGVTELIQELGILKYELKFFEREISSLPRDKTEKAQMRKVRTFKNICAVEKEIATRMKGRIPV